MEEEGIVDADGLEATRDVPSEHVACHEGEDEGVVPRHFKDDNEGGEGTADDGGEHGTHAQEDAASDDFGVGGELWDPFAKVVDVGKACSDEGAEHASEKEGGGEEAAGTSCGVVDDDGEKFEAEEDGDDLDGEGVGEGLLEAAVTDAEDGVFSGEVVGDEA